MQSNTLAAYYLAAQKGADMIETDARMTKDGVLIVNHDADVKGFDKAGNSVSYVISETNSSIILNVILSKDDLNGIQYVPTLEQALQLAYFTGMCVNIDLKEGMTHAAAVARLVVNTGMRGRTVYATNGAGAAAIKLILEIDPQARFIDTKNNFTSDALADIEGYPAKCYAYTSDFSDENIAEIRKSGCMLATISLNSTNAEDAFRHHPDMAEYPHTSDFEEIDRKFFENWKCF
jgi:glycerophosphoryl diester phosphodiesterase